MANLNHCISLAGLSAEDRAEIEGFVKRAGGNEVAGIRAYDAALFAEEQALFSEVIDQAGQKSDKPDLETPPDDPFSGSIAERADLRRRIAHGAERAEIDNHPAFVAALAEANARAENATDLSKTYDTTEWHSSRQYVFGPEEVVGTAQALPRWFEQAIAFAGGPVRRDKLATIVIGPPASGKSGIAEELARTKGAALLDSDEIKKTLPEFEGGIGAMAVHEESSHLADHLEGLIRQEGVNVVYPKVGGSPGSVRDLIARFKADGYTVELANMAVSAENAYARMVARFVTKGRLIDPTYVDSVGENPSTTFRTLKQEDIADGYAEIDNNGAKQDPKAIREIQGINPFAGSRYDEAGGQRALPPEPSGESDLGLYEEMKDRVPTGVREIDKQLTVETTTRAELAAELDADDEFAEVLGACLT